MDLEVELFLTNSIERIKDFVGMKSQSFLQGNAEHDNEHIRKSSLSKNVSLEAVHADSDVPEVVQTTRSIFSSNQLCSVNKIWSQQLTITKAPTDAPTRN